MDVKKAASNTLIVVDRFYRDANSTAPTPLREEDGQGIGHQMWCLNEIVEGNVTGEKAHRWLGWAQGYLAANGVITLEAAKYANLFS